MKKSLISLAIASTISMGANAGVTDLLITEMTQSGDAKVGAVEITNTGADAFTFTKDTAAYAHASGKHNNLLEKGDGTQLLTGVKLEAGKSLVIVNKNATDDFKAAIEANGSQVIVGQGKAKYTDLYLNGDDGFYLKHNKDIIDIVGASKDSTIVRRFGEGEAVPAQANSFDIQLWQKITPLTTSTLGKVNYAEYVRPFTCENLTAISAIQGDKSTSSEVGNFVGVQGIVTAITQYPVKGFYLRDLDANNDNNPLTSDGIFVKSSKAKTDMVGQTLCFGSEVSETDGQTQLEANNWEVTDANPIKTTATPIEVMDADKGSFAATLERYEGMLVKLPADMDPQKDGEQDMRVTRSFSFDYSVYRNSMTLAYTRPNFQPNHLHPADSPEARAAWEQNNDYRLVLESTTSASERSPVKVDGKSVYTPYIPYYSDFNTDPHNNYIRIDDSVTEVEGVISQSAYGVDTVTSKPQINYSLTVTQDVTSANFKHNLPRTAEPDLSVDPAKDHFDIRIASQNLLNLFNSPIDGDNNNFGQSRGAESEAEYLRQRSKLVQAIRAQDADVMALMEMENNGFGKRSAIAELVNQINLQYTDERAQGDASPQSHDNRYVFVGFDNNGNQVLDDQDAIGSDSIATGIIYRPAKMSVERARVIKMPQQRAEAVTNDNGELVLDQYGQPLEDGKNYHRDALVVTFIVNQTGKRLTLSVNHLKSKGSTCFEDWANTNFGTETSWHTRNKPADNSDLQGNCNEFRVAGAVRLAEEMEKVVGDKIILGDLNAYGKEDPLLVLTENPRNKTIVTARDTFLGVAPQFNAEGSPVTITKSYGYVDIVGKKFKEKGKTPWSFSYNDVVGALDHILIAPSLESRVIDATDWHINAAESGLYSYSNKHKGYLGGGDMHKFFKDDVYRSSDHDPALITLQYLPGEADAGVAVRLPKHKNQVKVPYQLPAGVKKGDIATLSLTLTDDEKRLDLSQMVLPKVTITQDDQTMATFTVVGAPSSDYYANMSLTRDGQAVANSERSFTAKVGGRDPLVAGIVKEESDGTGGDGGAGSTGFISLLSLFGLAAMRRRLRK